MRNSGCGVCGPAGAASADGDQRLSNGSSAWGLDLCLGCCSEMPGGAANVCKMIAYFGPKGRICYVHFRGVQGILHTLDTLSQRG